MSIENLLKDYSQKILAAVVLHENVEKNTYQYLDREDIRENLSFVRKWLKRYDKADSDGILSLLKIVVSQQGTPFYNDTREMLIEKTGCEQKVVDLDEAVKSERPCRVNRLKDYTAEFDELFVYSALADSLNNMRAKSAKDKRTPAQKVLDMSKTVKKFSDIMNGADSVSGIDAAELSDEDLARVEEGARLENLVWPLEKVHTTLKGIYEKSLNFVAAPQGSYKTRFLVQMAAMNVLGGVNTAYVTAEMDGSEMTQAIFYACMCMHTAWESLEGSGSKWHKSSLIASKCSSYKEIKGKVPDFFNHVISELTSPSTSGVGRLLVLDATQTPDLEGLLETLEGIDVKYRETALDENAGLGVIYLDYLGILDTPKDIRKKSQDEQGEWRAGFAKKRIAMGFCGRGIPVVSAHQINREGQKRTDKKEGGLIKSYDLAGSGWIERYADSCVVLKKLEDDTVQIHSVKSRRTEDVKPFLCYFDKNSRYLVPLLESKSDLILNNLKIGLD